MENETWLLLIVSNQGEIQEVRLNHKQGNLLKKAVFAIADDKKQGDEDFEQWSDMAFKLEDLC